MNQLKPYLSLVAMYLKDSLASLSCSKIGRWRINSRLLLSFLPIGRTFMGLMIMGFGLSSCSFMGIYDQSFECPPEDGIQCTSTSRLNHMVDHLKEDSLKEGSIDRESVKEGCRKDPSRRQKTILPTFPSYKMFPPSRQALRQEPTLYGEPGARGQTMRIWLAPQFIEGGMLEETYAHIDRNMVERSMDVDGLLDKKNTPPLLSKDEG